MVSFHYENDATDYWRWLEVSKTLPDNRANGSYELDVIQDTIVNTEDAALAYYCAETYSHRRDRMQTVVIASGSAKYAFLFATLSGSDIKALQKALFAADDRKWLCRFACYVPGASIKKIANLIAETDDPYCVSMLIEHLPKIDAANMKRFKKTILKSKKGKYCYGLAKQLTSRKEIAKIEDILIEQQAFTYIRLLAQNHPLASIKKLEQAVLDSGNATEAKKFAKSVKGSKLRQISILL